MRIVAINEFGEIERPLRNIRFKVDGKSMTADLIPEEVCKKPYDASQEANDTVKKLIQGAHLVVEAKHFLRLEFEYILAIAVDTDIDVDLFGGLQQNWNEAPRLPASKSFYPFLQIENSPWKQQLPDYRGQNNPDFQHFRLISAECSLDILGTKPTGTWKQA